MAGYFQTFLIVALRIVVRKVGSASHLPLQNDQRSTAFSAPSRLFDLNAETSTARTKQISAIIAPT
jgi:hypothetical protein